MKEAIRISIEKMEAGAGGPFGAVIARNNRVLAIGWNKVTSFNDPTAHAEIVAIRNACRALNSFSLEGCTLYVSCEPCPMCLAAVYWAKIDKLYFAATRTDAEAAGFADNYIYQELVLPRHEKSLSMEQIMRDAAIQAFALWDAKEDKILY